MSSSPLSTVIMSSGLSYLGQVEIRYMKYHFLSEQRVQAEGLYIRIRTAENIGKIMHRVKPGVADDIV